MRPETFAAIQAHAGGVAPREACGLIIRRASDQREEYRPCTNLADGPDTFALRPEDWAAAEDSGQVLAVCHSHHGADRAPSGADRAGCNASGLPWFILGNDGLHRLDPVGYALEGRPFEFGWADCWTMVRDYFGASWPDFPRVWGQVEDLFRDHLQDFGFRQVDAMEPGDVLLMQVRGHGINHLAIYIGDGQILHHAVGQLSRRVPLGRGIEQVRAIMRRPE